MILVSEGAPAACRDIPTTRKLGGRPVFFSEERTEGSWGGNCQPPGPPLWSQMSKVEHDRFQFTSSHTENSRRLYNADAPASDLAKASAVVVPCILPIVASVLSRYVANAVGLRFSPYGIPRPMGILSPNEELTTRFPAPYKHRQTRGCGASIILQTMRNTLRPCMVLGRESRRETGDRAIFWRKSSIAFRSTRCLNVAQLGHDQTPLHRTALDYSLRITSSISLAPPSANYSFRAPRRCACFHLASTEVDLFSVAVASVRPVRMKTRYPVPIQNHRMDPSASAAMPRNSPPPPPVRFAPSAPAA